jgi:type I restriction enzyme S subunit
MREGWVQTALTDICNIQQGQTLAVSAMDGGDFPVFGANGIIGNHSAFNYSHKVVALGCRGSCGTVHLVNQSAWLANNVMAIWPKDLSSATADFIALLIETSDLRSTGVISGQVQPQITRTSLAPLSVLVPPLTEQRRIVDMIESVDDYITALEIRAKTARTARAALLRDLLSNRGSPDSAAIAFQDFALLKRGHDLPTQDRIFGDIPVVASNGIVGFHDKAKVDPPGVVTGRSGTIGKVMLLKRPYWPLNTTLYVTDFKRNVPAYVALVLESMDLSSFAGGSTVPSLDRKVLNNVKVHRPSLDTQQEIVEIASSIDMTIDELEKTANSMRNLRAALLSDLLSGNHEIPASYDQLLGAA